MNPADPKHPWQRLVRAARQVPQEHEAAAPYGFSTRIAALAVAAERPAGSLFERFALRALGVACLLAVASVAFNYSVFTSGSVDDDLPFVTEDPVTVLLALS